MVLYRMGDSLEKMKSEITVRAVTSIECSAQAHLGSNKFHHDPWKSFYREHVVGIEIHKP